MTLALENVLAPGCTLSSAARLVVIAVVKRMNWKPVNGQFVAFMGIRDIAERTGLSSRCVQTKLKEIDGLVPPLLLRRMSCRTRGQHHKACSEYELVTSPVDFLRAREVGKSRAASKRQRQRLRERVETAFDGMGLTKEQMDERKRTRIVEDVQAEIQRVLQK